jgi:hypothetical protein
MCVAFCHVPMQDDRSHHTAHTPGLAAYTPSAYTPSAATPAMYTDTHQAPTPALDPGTVGPPPVAGKHGECYIGRTRHDHQQAVVHAGHTMLIDAAR